MKEDFFKFPSTPHLAAFADMDFRSDKLLSDAERNAFLQQNLLVEEKIDGANLGISFDSEGNLLAQNRGAYLFLPGDRMNFSSIFPISSYFSGSGAMPNTLFIMTICQTGFLVSIFSTSVQGDFSLRSAETLS